MAIWKEERNQWTNEGIGSLISECMCLWVSEGKSHRPYGEVGCLPSVLTFGLEVVGSLYGWTSGASLYPLLCQGSVVLGLGQKGDVLVFHHKFCLSAFEQVTLPLWTFLSGFQIGCSCRCVGRFKRKHLSVKSHQWKSIQVLFSLHYKLYLKKKKKTTPQDGGTTFFFSNSFSFPVSAQLSLYQDGTRYIFPRLAYTTRVSG